MDMPGGNWSGSKGLSSAAHLTDMVEAEMHEGGNKNILQS